MLKCIPDEIELLLLRIHVRFGCVRACFSGKSERRVTNVKRMKVREEEEGGQNTNSSCLARFEACKLLLLLLRLIPPPSLSPSRFICIASKMRNDDSAYLCTREKRERESVIIVETGRRERE